MCTWQNGKKLIISVMTVFILVIYYSLYRHPYDLKLALTHHSYHRQYPYQSYNRGYQNTSFTVTITTKTVQLNNTTHYQSKLYQQLPPLFNYSESSGEVVLNISNVQLNLVHFQLVQLKSNKIKKCQQNYDNLQNSLLVINTNTKSIGLKYMNLIRSIVTRNKYGQSFNQGQQQKCINFKIFLLREKHILVMDDYSSIEQYTRQLWRTIKKINDLTNKKFSLITSEQGSALLLRSFVDSMNTGEFKGQLSQKIDKIILLNMYNDAMLINAPISNYLDTIKREIMISKQKLKLFNALNLVIINTGQRHYRMLGRTYYDDEKKKLLSVNIANSQEGNYQEDSIQQQQQYPVPISEHYFVFEKEIHWVPSIISDGIQLIQRTTPTTTSQSLSNTPTHPPTTLTLHNTTILHTMQITNLHLSLQHGDYFHYIPFLEVLANFIIDNSLSSMSLKGIQYYFKYGETHGKFPLELLADVDVKDCLLYNINTAEPIMWMNNQKCFKLNLTTSITHSAYLLYSESKQFHVYTEGLNKIAPFDKQLNKSLYMFEKLQHPVIIYNPKSTKIILTIGEIFTPANPLTKIFVQNQILYINQLPHKQLHQGYQNKKFIIRMCQSDNLLVFPDNFPIGKVSRQFLLQQSSSSCYNEDNNSYKQFMDKITSNWTILRNIVILILLKKLFIKSKVRFADLTLSFLSISLILYYTQLKGYHNILVMFTVYVIDQVIKLICQLSQHINIDRIKVFIAMTILYAVSYICECFQFQRYNYWKMLLIFLIFFINEDNAIIIGAKLYYLRDYVLYWHQDMFQIVQLALFMYLTRTTKEKKELVFDSAFWLIKICLLIGLIFFMIYSPNTDSFHSVLNFYIKCTILMSFLKAYLEYKGWKGTSNTQTKDKR